MSFITQTRTCARCDVPLAADHFLDTCDACEEVERAAPRVSRCRVCAEPSAADVCASCQSKIVTEARPVLVLDTETELMRPGCMAPRLACVSYADDQDCGLVHHTEARDCVVAALESDVVLVGHHFAYDMVVFCAEYPDLIPLIFEVYAADRVTDTLLREKLVDIARGTRQFGESGFQKYSLEAVARRRLGIEVEKEEGLGLWRKRFGELRPLPLSAWPQDAKDYAVGDSVVEFAVWRDQQERDSFWLKDQYRQARAAFWLQLMSVWGLHTDEAGVREFARKTQQKYDTIAQELIEAGLMRVKKTKKKATGLIETTLVRNIKAVKVRMVEVCERDGKRAERTPPSGAHPEGQVKTDADCCERSKDPVLVKYADLSSLSTTLSTYVPLLLQGVHTPIHTAFDSLVATGRTSSSPNVQNLPTEMGVRECFVPRPGKVFAIGDYSGMELRTWAQVCLGLFGESEMAKALNAGIDPHTKLASMILGISYEQAVEEYAADPKGRVYLPRQTGKVGNFGYAGGLGYTRMVEFARKNYGVILELDDARDLKEYWKTAWSESQLYADWIAAQCEDGEALIEQAFVNRFRGGLGYTDASNTLFQALAADAAKSAGFLIARACYAQPTSVLYGGRPVDFVHDEFLVEVDDNEYAHDAAMELSHLMILGAAPFLPDVPPKVEPLLARRWSKSAKPVHGPDGRLVPWDWKVAA